MIVLTNTTYNKTNLSLFTSRKDFRRWPVASQLEAKQWSGGRLSARQAVLGGWLKWEQGAEGMSHNERQQGGIVETGEPDSADRA